MRKFIKESKRAEYWASRATSALRLAEHRERPDVILRRIEELEAQERKFKRDNWRHDTKDRWLEHVQMRLAFERARYEESGGIPVERDAIKIEVGDLVKSWRGWSKVLKVNKKSVTVQSPWSWTELINLADIKEVRKPGAEKGEG